MQLLPTSLQVVIPSLLARYLPVLLYGQHLEAAPVTGLVPVVAAIVSFSLVSNLLLFRSRDRSLFKQCACGALGLILGSIGFHGIVVLFGAPVVDLWRQTLLLAVLLSSCTTMPLALHFGCAPRKWLDLLLELSATNTQDLYLVSSSIGAMLGTYVGALPIPLDWDRPWQQWPLTCVYGTLLGHATGIVVSIAIGTTSKSFVKLTKKE